MGNDNSIMQFPADAGEKSAVARRLPWALAIREPLDRAIAAYQTRLPLFEAATAKDGYLEKSSNE